MSKPYFTQQQRPTGASASVIRQNDHPSAAKKTVSINPMFAHSKTLKRQREDHDEISGFLKGFSPVKHPIAQPDFLQNFGHTKKRKTVPKAGYLQPTPRPRFDVGGNSNVGAGKAYQRFGEAQVANETALRDRLGRQLKARQSGLDAHGNPLKRAHVPTDEENAALEAEIQSVSQDVNEEVVSISNGKNKLEIRIGDALNLYSKCQERTAAKVQQYQKELRNVEKEIEAGVKLLEGECTELKEAERQLHEQEITSEKEKQKAEKRAKKDLEKLRKDTKVKTAEFNRQIQEVVDGYK